MRCRSRDTGGNGIQEPGWREGGLLNKVGRLAVYVGEAMGVYEVAGNLADSKAEFMLLAEPYGSGACAQATL